MAEGPPPSGSKAPLLTKACPPQEPSEAERLNFLLQVNEEFFQQELSNVVSSLVPLFPI